MDDGSCIYPPVSLTATVSDISCYGQTDGYINLHVIGGASPYTYLWSNGLISEDIYNLSSGTYSVVVTDSLNQQATASFNIIEPDSLYTNYTVINASGPGVNDGAIYSYTFGGTPPYTYYWLSSYVNDTTQHLLNIPPGSYTSYILDANGCFTYELITVGYDSVVYGCTDSCNVCQYNPLATLDDGSCTYCYLSYGCTDSLASNYDPTVCYDDGSCIAPVLGCTDPNASNYDASANTTIASGGAIDNTFGTGGYFNGDQHLVFDASKECIIKSATIYSEASNTITFELRNSGSVVIDDTTLSVSSGQQTVNLNFEVPIGNDMQLGVAQGALQNVGLYRNNASASYPYDIASAINITNSSAFSQGYPGYYYFYYDIEVETPCQGGSSITWDCDGQGGCYDPGTGNGQYSSLAACQSNCIAPSWDCDASGTCYDPGTGNGQYSSLAACQSNCIAPVSYTHLTLPTNREV